MKSVRDSVVLKLKADAQRYLNDFSLNTPWKLILVIDFWPVLLFRIEEYVLHLNALYRVPIKILLLVIRPIIKGLSGTRIFSGAKIGAGFLMHTSVGVVITGEAEIGENCTIFSGVSIVHKADGKGHGAPSVGDNVKLMSGSKVIGAIKIGDNVIVGANSVVLTDIPSNVTVVGVPARNIHEEVK